MTAAILKRREWGRKFGLDDQVLFDLFSEFSSMMMIGKADAQARRVALEKEAKLAGRTGQKLPMIPTPASDSSESHRAVLTQRMNKIMPTMHNVKMSLANKKTVGQTNAYALDDTDLEDFRVPIKTFRKYSSVMKGLNQECQNSFLSAMGIDINFDRCKISWESFVSIYCLLKLNTATPEEYVEFMCKVMDPHQQIRVPDTQYV